jgi:translation initiation factor 3 subunit D
MSLPSLFISFNFEDWGPLEQASNTTFNNVPYAHFDKKGKCGKAADLSAGTPYQRPQYQRYNRREEPGFVNTEFAYKHDTTEDSSFQLVDTSKSQSKNRGFGAKKTWNQQGGRGRGGRFASSRNDQNLGMTGTAGRGQQGGRGGGGRFGGRFGRGGNRRERKIDRLPSLVVHADWEIVEEFDLPQLLKLQTNPPVVEDITWCGQAEAYEESFDKVTTKTAKTLQKFEDRVFYNVTTSDDPVLEKLDVEGAGNVFATDAILSLLMAAPRSIYSWDLVLQKLDGSIYMDKRENSDFDFLTVSETALDPPIGLEEMDEFNSADRLSYEATMINQNFSQQVLRSDDSTTKKYEPNPFFEDDGNGSSESSLVYRYRKFTMGNIKVVARTELHGWCMKLGQEQFMSTYALNEWDSKHSGGIEWRRKVDAQRGAVLATELKNNSCKLARWTAQSILAGADLMKVGYVSRSAPKNPHEHTILATQFFKPKDLGAQINLSVVNMWGIVKMICDLIFSHQDGKFVLLKDPNRPSMRLYSVPMDSFEEEPGEKVEEGVEQ